MISTTTTTTTTTTTEDSTEYRVQYSTVQDSTPGGMHGRVRYYSSTVLPQRNKMDTTRPPCMTLRSKMKALNK